jgi:hypothetical protein
MEIFGYFQFSLYFAKETCSTINSLREVNGEKKIALPHYLPVMEKQRKILALGLAL